MSNFYCEKCGTAILDSPGGIPTGCEHYPLLKRDYDWRKEFENKFWDAEHCEDHLYCIEKFIEDLLIKILAECESAKDAREARHIIKNYLLNDHGK